MIVCASVCVLVFVFDDCRYEIGDSVAGFVQRSTYRPIIESFKIDGKLFWLFSISMRRDRKIQSTNAARSKK